ncbi:D-alanine--D-alanine ligase [Wenzhouxiangella sp. C33]|uniref:D-alanine--D-alanine ligase n=2 Tax=Wenzhouxiangella limi TaxID=2707351 RepID=A0A845V4F1_9GAMM|nr:D-alanine--D-alanine ligase [Wenzhouxiangella limi]
MKNVFVMGLDPFNEELLETIDDQAGSEEKYCFHPLLDLSEIVDAEGGEYPSLDEVRERAKKRFTEVEGGPDAVMGYWDFPTSSFVPVVAHDAGLPAQPLEAVARCEHKYWSRLEQKKVLPDMVPEFQALNPFSEDPAAEVRINYPFWLKPVKSHSSFLGFYIDGPDALREHIPEIREKIGLFAKPFNEFLALLDQPEEVAAVDGYHCIAEEIISSGFQATVEGYCWHGEVQVFGAIDSLRSGKHQSSFSRYQYPSKLPREIQARMIKAARTFMRHIEYDQGTFNIEFFWDHDDDSLMLLEVNSRISKSHSPLFFMVDGATNHKVVLDLALGREPDMPHRKGEHELSGKFMMRIFKDEVADGVVRQVPDEDDIERVRERYPDAFVLPLVEEGTRLSDLKFQDSYSYEIAVVFLGADRQKQLLDRFDKVEEMLPFKIDADE